MTHLGANSRNLKKGSAAILFSTDGRLLLQLRDDLPHVTDPGKLSMFGGRCEGDESFLECVVRERHEEIGYYLPPERFELIARYFGPHHAIPDTDFHGEIFLARHVPIDGRPYHHGKPPEGHCVAGTRCYQRQSRDAGPVGLGILANRQL